jgi:hypothetical protein
MQQQDISRNPSAAVHATFASMLASHILLQACFRTHQKASLMNMRRVSATSTTSAKARWNFAAIASVMQCCIATTTD